MKDLIRYVVTKYAADWKDIGLELGLPFDIFGIIEQNFPCQHVNCLREILAEWLNFAHNATWRSLETALTNVRRQQLGLDPVDDVYRSVY